MFSATNFSHVFAVSVPFPYDRKFLQESETFRKSFDGALFIDRVLKALGISKAKVYPPKTENALKALHHLVCDTNMSMHHRLSIFYYLLLDYDYIRGKSQLAETFATNSGVPKKYQIFMKGLWHMDRQQFEQALEYISHPSLIPDFADDIITALVRHSPDDDYRLPLAYFSTVQPIIRSPHALQFLFTAMARTNVTEALYFSRTYPEHTRELLFQQLVSSVLDPQRGEGGASRAKELVDLPLDAVEDGWLEETFTTGDGKKMKMAKDVLLMRCLATSRFSEATKLKGASEHLGPITASIKAALRSVE